MAGHSRVEKNWQGGNPSSGGTQTFKAMTKRGAGIRKGHWGGGVVGVCGLGKNRGNCIKQREASGEHVNFGGGGRGCKRLDKGGGEKPLRKERR